MATKRKPAAAPPREAEIVRLDVANEVVTVESLSLEELAKQANAEHKRALKAAESAAGRAFRCGQLLLEARKRVESEGGRWLLWLAQNCEVKKTQAYRYMALAESGRSEFPRVGTANLDGASLRSALEAIGKPVEQAEKKAKQSERIAQVVAAADPRIGVDERRPAGEPPREERDPDERRDVFKRAAAAALQIVAVMRADRLIGLPPVYASIRDEAVAELTEWIGRQGQTSDDARESLAGSKRRR